MSEQEILNMMRTEEVLSIENAEVIENAIDNGDIDTRDLFEDFMCWVSENEYVEYKVLLDFVFNYENLRSHKENLETLLSSLK